MCSDTQHSLWNAFCCHSLTLQICLWPFLKAAVNIKEHDKQYELKPLCLSKLSHSSFHDEHKANSARYSIIHFICCFLLSTFSLRAATCVFSRLIATNFAALGS